LISINNLSLQFGGDVLFSRVDLQFTGGNCYGVIGANGAGKSTFLRILSGELEPSSGSVVIKPGTRMSVLKQDQTMYDDLGVLDTVIMGDTELIAIGREKDELYAKEDFTEADGVRAAELEERFAELGGWEAESNAAQLLTGLGIPVPLHDRKMAELEPRQKVKVLLAQALFGSPDIILLDEPTNNLDVNSVVWLEDFLADYAGTVIVVSHDRYFLNTVCTHIVDIDFGKIRMYVGNYDFWYDASQLMQRLAKEQNKKNEDKARDLEEFIRRFSANKSKSRQATSRRKLLDKITLDDMPASSRKYPWVGFAMAREPGKDRLFVTDVTKTVDGVKVLDGVSFIMNKGDKIAFIGGDENTITLMFSILAGTVEPDSGEVKWGVSTTQAHFPKDNSEFFDGVDTELMEWIRQFSPEDKRESYLRTFLGRMLFSGDDAYKQVKVLSGGEKVRCMLSKMMLSGASVLLFDQPTNHLDLESIAALNNGMSEFQGNIIFTTHDHQLIQTVANRIIEFRDGKIYDYPMTYDEYLDKQNAANV
jgi:ATPase subunit of ABC transporter with duplicated ATPase domains